MQIQGSDVAPESITWVRKAIIAVLVTLTIFVCYRFVVSKGIEVGTNSVAAGVGVNLSDLNDANDLNGAISGLGTLDQWENIEDVEGFKSGGFGGVFND